MSYSFTCIAADPLKNLSVGVKEGQFVRNIESRVDFYEENIVLICQVPELDGDEVFDIPAGTPVRCMKLNAYIR